jgi:putative oxidoreductase
MTTIKPTREDWGLLVLRIAFGGLMLFHGVAKLQHGVEALEGMLESRGLPTALVGGVYVGEIVAPLLLLLGLWARPAAAVLVVDMLFAIWVAHPGDVLALNEQTGAWAIELPALYLLGGLAIALLGAGRIAVRVGGGGSGGD